VARLLASRLDEHALAERALRIARRTALGVLGDREAAADVAQEVAVQALRHRAALREEAALDAWIHRIAARAALKAARRDRSRRTAEVAAVAARSTDGDGVDAALGSALTALSTLPARERAALTLRYVHDLDDDAIAAVLGCRRGTVWSLLSRGRARLRTSREETDR
jgi:RNA polymerase sigma-70 factor (ECF subfamily)